MACSITSQKQATLDFCVFTDRSARLESEKIKKKIAETVVIYVRVTDKNERLIFHARYGNCYERPNANKAHELPEYQEGARQKLRQTYRQLPFENEENTDCHTAMHVCKGSEYILVRSTSGTELNYNFPL